MFGNWATACFIKMSSQFSCQLDFGVSFIAVGNYNRVYSLNFLHSVYSRRYHQHIWISGVSRRIWSRNWEVLYWFNI